MQSFRRNGELHRVHSFAISADWGIDEMEYNTKVLMWSQFFSIYHIVITIQINMSRVLRDI